ncbi:hypothetical protein HDU79_008945 [Rhizoclosmatium sp. JEL0117]|nr:hypothetical protein HDU79_008945 [Rhizoclosmatium sp. JEL0117]
MTATPAPYRFNPLNNFGPLTQPQLSEYLARIHYPIPSGSVPEPTLSTLNNLVLLHATHIPFENGHLRFLDIKPSLKPDSLFQRIVTDQRGGYCFQVNTLVAMALRAIGFNTSTGVARSVVWDSFSQEYVLGATTHMIVFVQLNGYSNLHLVDLGYNRIGQTAAIELVPGAVVDSVMGEKHRIVESSITAPGNFILQHKRASGVPLADGVDPNGDLFGPVFYCTLERFRPEDYEVYNYFVSHSPVHVMMKTFICSKVTETGGRAEVVDRKFRRREGEAYKHLEKSVEMKTIEEFVDILRTEFGISLSSEEADGARKVLGLVE